MEWFETLFGFPEKEWSATKAQFTLEGTVLTSNVNGRSFDAGTFETPSVAELRARIGPSSRRPRVRHEAIGDGLDDKRIDTAMRERVDVEAG